MSIVHALGNYCFYFLLAWLPLFLTKSRGFTIGEMTLLATLGYAVQGACALGYGHFSDWWTRSGRSEAACRRWMMVASQLLAAASILGLAFATDAVTIGILLCLAGAAPASLSLNLYAVAQMFAGPRASGTWVGVQNAIGNLSGIVGPIVTGIVVQRSGYDSAFILTAVVAVRSVPPGGPLASRKSNKSTWGRNNRRTESFSPRHPHFFRVALTFSLGLRLAMIQKIHGGGSTRLAP